jgi:2'-5' RNA ligase
MSLLRAFIALDIPGVLQQTIHETARALQREIGPLVRWAPVGNLHLTLKFLGDISPAGAEEVARALDALADSCEPFEMQFSGLGVFPNPRRPRVIIIKIQAPAGLEALYRRIESACTRMGIKPEERPFSPHLTIGRVRQYLRPDDGKKIIQALESSTIDSLGTARVDSVQLYKSDLKPDGAAYTKLFSAPFKP